MRTSSSGIFVAGALVAALNSFGCAASHRITRFDSTSVVADQNRAAYYALPRTVLQVSFEAKKVEVEKGVCFDALKEPASAAGVATSDPIWKVLGFRKLPTAGVAFLIEETPSLAVLAEPDPDEIFRADLASSLFIKRKIELNYGPLGVLQSATSLAQDRTLDYAVAIVKLFAGGAMLALPPGALLLTEGTEEIAISASCKEAINAIHEDRVNLKKLSGLVQAGDLSKSAAEWFKSELQSRIDKALLQFAKGNESSTTVSCAVRPKKNGVAQNKQAFKLLSLNRAFGVKSLGDATCLIPGDFLSEDSSSDVTKFTLEVAAQPDQFAAKFEKQDLDKGHDPKTAQGFYYRVPAVAQVTLRRKEPATDPTTGAPVAEASFGKQILFSKDVIVAQLGIVAALPSLHAYQTQYTITLDPMTGGLQKLSSESETPDPKLIGTLESALDEEQKARSDAKKAAAAASDELALLERERKLLEEQKKIRDLRNELGVDGQ